MQFHDAPLIPYWNERTEKNTYVNTDHEFFSIIPTADLSNLNRFKEDFTEARTSAGNSVRRVLLGNQVQIVHKLLNSQDLTSFRASFSILFNELCELKDNRNGLESKQRALLMKLVIRLWSEGIILFPAGILSGKDNCVSNIYKNLTLVNEPIITGDLHSVINIVHGAKYYDSANTNDRVVRRLRALLLCVGPITDLSEINFNIFDSIIKIAPIDTRDLAFLYRGLNVLGDIQKSTFGKALLPYQVLVAKTKEEKPTKTTRTKNSDFMWCVEKDPSLENWRFEISESTNKITNMKNITRIVVIMNKLLDYLVKSPHITRNPIEYIESKYNDDLMVDYILDKLDSPTSQQQYLSALHSFFEDLLNKYATADDGDEGKFRMQGFSNPIRPEDIPSQNVVASHTYRIPMPRVLVEKAKEIICENDFAWCKKIKEDNFTWHNPETGATERIWSPVRAFAILNKMTIPLRTYQVRMLESGEGDPEKFDAALFKWVPNTGVHANPKKHSKHPSGFLKKMYDGEKCSYFTGLYVNTNKTQDRQTLFIDTGYDIPWENKEIIYPTCTLREFQEKYNPVDGPTPYTELTYEAQPSKDVASRIPSRFYLFRDPCADNKRAPVTDGRLQSFWKKLLRELQTRLNKDKTLDSGDRDIILIEGNKCEFDLHSLRVTGLTALAQSGVSIEILSRLVAGHATILMTLFYTKFDIAHITEALNDAQQLMDEKAQEEFTRFLKSNPLRNLKKTASFNSIDAVYLAHATQPAAWRFLDYGICPAGCTKCDEGGPLITDQKDRKVYQPVPGGMNCAMCRFFLTGAPYLFGLVAKYNETVGLLDAHSTELRRHQTELQRLERERIVADENGDKFLNRKSLLKAEGNLEEAMDRVDVCGMTLHHLYNLVHQSHALLMANRSANDGSLHLICSCDPEQVDVHLAECSQYAHSDDVGRLFRRKSAGCSG